MKNYITFVCLFVTVLMYGQDTEKPFELQKKHLYLKLELENRITPYSSENPTFVDFDSRDAIFNLDRQNTGLAFGYKLQYFVTKNVSLGFGHTFRNASIIYERVFPEIHSSAVAQKAFVIDSHLEASYYFKVFKKGTFHVTLGRSFMNMGSDYNTTGASFNSQGEVIGFTSGVRDFNFQPTKFEIGYTIKRFEASIGTYYDSETPYFDFINPTYFGYFKFSYYALKI